MKLTNAAGQEFPPLVVPPPGAPTEDIIAYLRAHASRNDTIASCANRAFDRAFRKSMRG